MCVVLEYTAVCHNNSVFILDGLSSSELQTGARLQQDLTDFTNVIGRHNYATSFKVDSKAMLIAVLKAIEVQCGAGVLMPALHFEFHGDPIKGLHVAKSDEYVSWDELVSYIAPINAASRNNTAVILASCYGYEMASRVKIQHPSPFHFVIGPSSKISAGALQDTLLPFYKIMAETGNLESAIRKLDSGFKHFICGEWFFSSFAAFMVGSFSSKVRAEMVEAIVSSEVAKAGYHNRQLLRQARAQARKYLARPEEFYLGLSRRFFHGKTPVPYSEFIAFVENQKLVHNR